MARSGASISGGSVIALDNALQDNYVINPDFSVWQRYSPTASNSVGDVTYGPDRWYILTQTANVNITRFYGGYYSFYPLQITQPQATAQRFGICQVVEHSITKPLRDRTVTFQFAARSSAANTVIRYAICTQTAIADTSVVKEVVNSWTNTNYTPGNFFVSANGFTVRAQGSTTVTNAGPDANGTDPSTQISLTTTIQQADENIFLFAWTSGTIAQNTTVRFEAVGLFDGTSPRLWQARLPEIERFLCSRYFTSSYSKDPATSDEVAPGTAGSTENQQIFISPNGAPTTQMLGNCTFPIDMRINPTVRIYNPATGTLNSVVRIDNNANQTVTGAGDISPNGFSRITGTGFTNSTRSYAFHYTADAEFNT